MQSHQVDKFIRCINTLVQSAPLIVVLKRIHRSQFIHLFAFKDSLGTVSIHICKEFRCWLPRIWGIIVLPHSVEYFYNSDEWVKFIRCTAIFSKHFPHYTRACQRDPIWIPSFLWKHRHSVISVPVCTACKWIYKRGLALTDEHVVKNMLTHLRKLVATDQSTSATRAR